MINERDDELQKKIDMSKLIRYSRKNVAPEDGDSKESLLKGVMKDFKSKRIYQLDLETEYDII